MYTVKSLIKHLPPHQRRHFAGKRVRNMIAGKNLLVSGSIELTEDEFTVHRETLKDMALRGEAEMFYPNGDRIDFRKPLVQPKPVEKKAEKPEKKEAEKEPPNEEPVEEPVEEPEKKPPKKKAAKKKKKK
jgi:hypothetical protein